MTPRPRPRRPPPTSCRSCAGRRCAASSAPGSWSTACWRPPRPSRGAATEQSGALRDAYGDRFQLASDISDDTVDERAELKAFVESCLILEEGIAGVRDIDLGDRQGVREGGRARARRAAGTRSSRPRTRWGEHFEPPLILRRLVAQGRLGVKAGQGFYPYPQVDAEHGPVKLDLRGDVAVVWIDNPPANSLGPATVEGLAAAWEDLVARGARAMVLASASPALFCAGADIKAFTTVGRGVRPRPPGAHPRAGARVGALAGHDDRRGQRARLRRRLRDRDGVRRPPGGPLGDLRPAGDQPRADPGLRRLAAARRGSSARPRRWR